MNKKCSKCGIEHPPEEFSKDNRAKSGLQSSCKLCKQLYHIKNREKDLKRQKQHYEENKEDRLEYARNRYITDRDKILEQKRITRDRNTKYVGKIKAEQGCCVCGESHSICLDFHHIDPKTKYKMVSVLVTSGYSLKTIQKEIDKCEIICANCHREKHFKKAPIGNNKKQKLVRGIKEKATCKDCGRQGIPCLVFHHRDPKIKLFEIGDCGKKEYTMEMLIEEIKKCDILCENCHRQLHYKLKQNNIEDCLCMDV